MNIVDEEIQKPLIVEEEEKDEEKNPLLFCEICYDNHPGD